MPELPSYLDQDLRPEDLQVLEDADALVGLLARLGWNTDRRIPLTPEALGLTPEGGTGAIRRVERLADQDGLFQVILFELHSVTVAQTRNLVRSFRNRAGQYLLVLTSDFERIDFVLVERFLPSRIGTTGPRTPQAGVRPRILTIDRRRPGAVEMRVLRRFTWTEQDAFAQYDKLVSAFAVADWSEEHFNNRALFSDYYLGTRLQEHPTWREDPLSAWRALRDLYANAANRLCGKPEGHLRTELIEPVFQALGFSAVPGKPAHSDGLEPDYRLFAPGDLAQPIAVCLTYPWGRSLDKPDDMRDQDTSAENPGAVVVSLLEAAEAGWVVVTNGKVWRLYAAASHSRATNYYEIDLEEVLAAAAVSADPAVAFRYFWLLFRCRAFVPEDVVRDGQRLRQSFLDTLLAESHEYAKELGERLKEGVFDRVFPHLAEGFLQDMRRRQALSDPPTATELDAVFQGTLTLLYRLLFLLYAEARGLLPVREVRGYFEASLTRIKKDVADAAGPIIDDVPERLARAFGKDTTALYDRLSRLFTAIDRGEAALNVPIYSGGLFNTAPADDDPSPEATAGRFLAANRVPDYHLARALDLLARDLDPKRQDLVPVDYKSLGVRQLGSIYEGLLEFRIRIATQAMAVVKEKSREVYVPLALVDDRTRQRAERDDRVIQPEQAYLENDRLERKATGSYYTPDPIVKHVVREAVGPALDARFESLRPRLRHAEAKRRAFFDEQEAFRARGLPTKPDAQADLIDPFLVDELFDVRVLDPAMGSGHFLVEVVDFVTDRIISFLNGFRWTPVTAHLDRIRDTILREMEDQGVTIDAARLTPVNLLKRHVLKRCIYGVDLNPMAVELAKVSLWLDCFTLGAPLSFLDHHMRCGNSLLGVTVNEVREALEGKEGEYRQLGLFESRFDRLLSATEFMRKVGDLTDITSAQVQESRDQYRLASDAMAPYKRILDTWTAQWFGAGDWKAFAAPVSRPGKARAKEPPAITLLKTMEARAFFQAEGDAQVGQALAALPAYLRAVAERVLDSARTYRFFHWELEFPEVFHRPRPGTVTIIERSSDAGFDAIVGNPPWIRQEAFSAFKEALATLHADVFDSVADTYVYFIGRALDVMAPGRRMGMVLPNKWMRADYGERLRSHLIGKGQPLALVDFGHAPIFPDADTFPCLLLVQKASAGASITPEFRFCAVPRESLPAISVSGLTVHVRATEYPVALDQLRPDGWTMLPPDVGRLVNKIRAVGRPLKDVVGASPYYGVKTGLNEAFLIDQATRDRLVREDPKCEPIIKKFLRGRDIERWHPRWGGVWMIALRSSENHSWPWANSGTGAEQVFSRTYPSIFKHMKALEPALRKRQDQGRYWWELRSCDYYDLLETPKLVYQRIQFHSWFAADLDGHYVVDSTFFLCPLNWEALATLNSAVVWWYMWLSAPRKKDEAFSLDAFFFENLPIVATAKEESRQLFESARDRHEAEMAFLNWVKAALNPDKLTQRLSTFWDLDEGSLFQELKKAGAHLNPAAAGEVRRRFVEARDALLPLIAESRIWEAKVHQAAFEAYGLTPEEIALIRRTAPPRDPLTLLEQADAPKKAKGGRRAADNLPDPDLLGDT